MKLIKSDMGYVLSGALILLAYAFYNGYPFVYSDTGTYIRTGFEGIVPFDRPIAYGLFIRLVSLKYSMWLVVLVQNLILSFVIFETFRYVVKSNFKAWFIITIFFLAMTTSVSMFSNQLMPDIFVAILGLSLFLLLFVKRIPLFTAVISAVSVLPPARIIEHVGHTGSQSQA